MRLNGVERYVIQSKKYYDLINKKYQFPSRKFTKQQTETGKKAK
ncbi:hypothetical protein GAGA_2882 [Paraglaciecola agarilytica NO2]|uniref:Uncharacterized protein n=1 Tax=Paraglaciecola agarilytica NO2 TaxID=1125747 RepID=A0ABQ0I8R4_9ALTE|nr:hypothetical protein GAGA_2882 [Paraglaciecola agarilytica NO2]